MDNTLAKRQIKQPSRTWHVEVAMEIRGRDDRARSSSKGQERGNAHGRKRSSNCYSAHNKNKRLLVLTFN
jgi:hypothetical protein